MGSAVDIPSLTFTSLLLSSLDSQDTSLRRVWKIKELPTQPYPSLPEIEAKNHYSSTVPCDSSGRFVVALPFLH